MTIDDSPLKGAFPTLLITSILSIPGKGKSVVAFKLRSSLTDRRLDIGSLGNLVVSNMLKPDRRFTLSDAAIPILSLTRPVKIPNTPIEVDERDILPCHIPAPSKAQALLGVRPAPNPALCDGW